MPSKKKRVEEIYQKKSQLEHILLRPDSYVGSTEKDQQTLFVLSSDKTSMTEESIEFAPALYKIFDEILVNAADNKQRDPSMKRIDVVLDETLGCVSVKNDGKGIPVQMHSEHDCYVPELIFGHLLTSSNYDDSDKKTVGGRNGYGAKLANIFSRKFRIDTVDSEAGLKYSQVWKSNMREKTEPKITQVSGSKDYTKVTFWPDFQRFGMEGFEPGICKLIEKRVWDIAGVTPKDLKVYFNGNIVGVSSFEQYCKLYLPSGGEGMRKNSDLFHWIASDGRCEVMFALNRDSEYKQISFVNSIWTIKGGTHVKSVLDQLVKYTRDNFKSREKAVKEMLRPAYIRNQVFVFVNYLIENPSFSSQTKEEMTLNKSKWGTPSTLPDLLLKKVFNKLKSNLREFVELKLRQKAKQSDGKKKVKIRVDDAIDDANHAGTKHGSLCTLILTEGLSAKTLAVAGLAVLPGGRDRWGIFPLKGKLLNVRDESRAKVNKNTELSNLKKVLGLKAGMDYTDDKEFKSLRYGRILIMTDQDFDGSHIKGLVVNWLHCEWPSLVQRSGFISQFITPILVVKKGKHKRKAFYTVPEYEQWKSKNNYGKGWSVKYYKGLGTWQRNEGKDHFSQLKKHKIEFLWRDQSDDDAIVKAFDKKLTDDRKRWLSEHREGSFMNFNARRIQYQDFIDKELILFSLEDCRRSIPCLVDGLKPGQRKILYSCFLKGNLKKEIRVAQLGGYVSEKSAYHHGEQSLYQTIIAMAQDFPGSNNLNLLMPNGMFGSRLKGGKDAASPRYIYTRLNPVTLDIFHPADNMILKFLDDDGFPVEPQFYMPIIPMVLVNGAEGIGTGWSTSIPLHNPRDLIANLRRRLLDKMADFLPMQPWFRGWHGCLNAIYSSGSGSGSNSSGSSSSSSPAPDSSNNHQSVSYETIGKCTVNMSADDMAVVHVSELPVRMWTENYKKHLEDLAEFGIIEEVNNNSNDIDVSFTITLDLRKTRAMAASKKKKGGSRAKKGGGSSSSMMMLREDSVSEVAGDSGSKKKGRKLTLAFTGEVDATFIKDMKLRTSISTSNMVLFDSNGKIKRYSSVMDILEEFYHLRLEAYSLRKKALLEKLKHELKRISNQYRFIMAVVNDTLIIRKRKKLDLIRDLVDQGFDQWRPFRNKNSLEARRAILRKIDDDGGMDGDENEDGSKQSLKNNNNDDDGSEESGIAIDLMDGDQHYDDDDDGDYSMGSAARLSDEQLRKIAGGYDYLLKMSLYVLTHEKMEELLKQQKEKEEEVETLKRTSIEDLWLTDLDVLESKLDDFDQGFEDRCNEAREQAEKAALKKGGAKVPTRKRTKTNNKTVTRKVTNNNNKNKTKKGSTSLSKKGESTSTDDTFKLFFSGKNNQKGGKKDGSNSSSLSTTAKKKSDQKKIVDLRDSSDDDEESKDDSSSPMMRSLAERARIRRNSLSGSDTSPVKRPEPSAASKRRIRPAKRTVSEMESSSSSTSNRSVSVENTTDEKKTTKRLIKPKQPSKKRRIIKKTVVSNDLSSDDESEDDLDLDIDMDVRDMDSDSENKSENSSNHNVVSRPRRKNQVRKSYREVSSENEDESEDDIDPESSSEEAGSAFIPDESEMAGFDDEDSEDWS